MRSAALCGHIRRFSQISSKKEDEVLKYLASQGYTGSVAQGMISAFSSAGQSSDNVSLSVLQAMGGSGLKSLAESVEREMKNTVKTTASTIIPVTMIIPHENNREVLMSGQEGDR